MFFSFLSNQEVAFFQEETRFDSKGAADFGSKLSTPKSQADSELGTSLL